MARVTAEPTFAAEPDLGTLLVGIAHLILEAYGDTAEVAAPVAKPAAKKTAKAKAAPEPEPEDDDEDEAEEDDEDAGEGDPQAAREAELNDMSLAALRKVAVALGFSNAEVKDADKDTLVASIVAEEFKDGDDEESDDEESEDEDSEESEDEESEEEDDGEEEAEESDDDDADEEAYTEDDLKAMSLAELKALAKEFGVKVVATDKAPQIVAKIMKLAG